MLELLKRSNVNVGSATWEYHGDTDEANLFYITPQPAWITDGNGLPRVQLVTYKTKDSLNGSGYCTMQVKLDVPTEVIAAVTANIQQVYGVSNPRFLSLPFQPGTLVSLTYPDGQGGTTGQQVAASDFGTNNAIFQLPLNADQMKTFTANLALKGGSSLEIQYGIMVPAIMPSLTMALSFDSSIALQYQVTSHEHTHWASSSTYTYDISKQLTSSGAASVVLTKVDPTIPQADVDRVRDWGQRVIENLVAQEVAAALALENSASGTQSFDVSQISSFTENYTERQTIIWRLQPQTVLPSFADLGLTTQQIASLEVTVDKRKLVATVTPACNFVGSEPTLNQALEAGESPYLSDEQKLKTLDVTLHYPTLEGSSTRTFTFTDNAPHVWEADWSEAAGGTYSLEYVATYATPAEGGTARQLHGEIKDIEASAYILTLEAIGILNVTFDASTFFANSSTQEVIKEIDVDFVYNIPDAKPLLRTLRLTNAHQSDMIHSYTAAPITTDYYYTVTYIFTDSKLSPFTTDAKQQNGPNVSLLAPVAQQSVGVTVNLDGLFQVSTDVYYTTPPYFPEGPISKNLPNPDSTNPLQLFFPKEGPGQGQGQVQTQTITLPAQAEPAALADGATPTLTQQRMNLFANSKFSPLTITATVITNEGDQYTVGPYQFTPQGGFTLTKNNSFATLTIDPHNVAWNLPPAGGADTAGTLTSINFNVRKVTYDLPTTPTPTPAQYQKYLPTQAITWNSQRQSAYGLYVVLGSLPVDFMNLAFEWEAEYVYKDGSKFARGTTAGNMLTLPPAGTAGPTHTHTPTRAKGHAHKLTKYLLRWQPGGRLQLN